MSEFTAPIAQTVSNGNNILFTNDVIPGVKCIRHRSGSGLVTLQGLTNQCNARFLVLFNGNISIPTGGTVQGISLAITLNGEPLGSSTMKVVPAAVTDAFNVSASTYITVPSGCCVTIAVENTSGQNIVADSSNLIVSRVS